MKKVGLQMGLLMGISLSFCLSLFGTIHAGHFTVPAFLFSFLLSAVISIVIGLLVPMPKLEQSLCGRLGVDHRSLGGNAVTSLLSDLIYTPVITLAQTILGYMQMKRGGGSAPFLGMFLGSLILSLLVGYVIIFILKPLYLKLVLKANGITPGEAPDTRPE